MNWLAHLYLSAPDIEFKLGNVLADYIKGKVWEGANPVLQLGVNCHQKIDIFTDSHPIVKHSKSRLQKKSHSKGIVMDVFYDHMLSLHWDRFCSTDLRSYLNQFYADSLNVIEYYPPDIQTFINNLIQRDTLGQYAEFSHVEVALERINNRLSPIVRQRSSVIDLIPDLKREYHSLESDFIEFFPLLIHYVENEVLDIKKGAINIRAPKI